MTDDEPIYVSANLMAVMQDLSLEARGVLVELIMQAAVARSKTLSVDLAFLQSLSSHEDDRRNAQAHFDELARREIVREVSPGVFLIAPGLWAFQEDMDKPDKPTLV